MPFRKAIHFEKLHLPLHLLHNQLTTEGKTHWETILDGKAVVFDVLSVLVREADHTFNCAGCKRTIPRHLEFLITDVHTGEEHHLGANCLFTRMFNIPQPETLGPALDEAQSSPPQKTLRAQARNGRDYLRLLNLDWVITHLAARRAGFTAALEKQLQRVIEGQATLTPQDIEMLQSHPMAPLTVQQPIREPERPHKETPQVAPSRVTAAGTALTSGSSQVRKTMPARLGPRQWEQYVKAQGLYLAETSWEEVAALIDAPEEVLEEIHIYIKQHRTLQPDHHGLLVRACSQLRQKYQAAHNQATLEKQLDRVRHPKRYRKGKRIEPVPAHIEVLPAPASSAPQPTRHVTAKQTPNATGQNVFQPHPGPLLANVTSVTDHMCQAISLEGDGTSGRYLQGNKLDQSLFWNTTGALLHIYTGLNNNPRMAVPPKWIREVQVAIQHRKKMGLHTLREDPMPLKLENMRQGRTYVFRNSKGQRFEVEVKARGISWGTLQGQERLGTLQEFQNWWEQNQ